MSKNKREEFHTYQQADKMAKVFLTNEGFEVDFYKDKTLLKTEPMHDHSEGYAEDAADNYVMGIKQLNG
jgi:hypothetical protein|tara:strand:- start:1090 stop:1296 length:207 start_codon:yes stop_codon:yes gene_type:complete